MNSSDHIIKAKRQQKIGYAALGVSGLDDHRSYHLDRGIHCHQRTARYFLGIYQRLPQRRYARRRYPAGNRGYRILHDRHGHLRRPIGDRLRPLYLSEYAKDTWLTRIIRIAIINLAGIPSVVYGLFGLGLFVLFLNFGTSIIAGSLTLAIMTLPVIISTSEEALRAVPQSFRIVSVSLGGTKWQTIRRVVLPQALPGILTGVILGLERAAGETAPILFTAAAFFLPRAAPIPL